MKNSFLNRALFVLALSLSSSLIAVSGDSIESAHDAVVLGDLETLQSLNNLDFTAPHGEKKDTLLLAAVRWGKADIANWILSMKSDPEYLELADSQGNTALMLAAYRNEDGIAETLISKGADIMKVDYDYIKDLCAANASIAKWVSERPYIAAAKAPRLGIRKVEFRVNSLKVNGREKLKN